MKRVLCLAIVLALFVAGAPARADQPLAGTWSGMLHFSGGEDLLFVITFKPGAPLTAVASSPFQGGGDDPVDSVSLRGPNLSFAVSKYGASFTGTLASGEISGTFSQGGANVPLVLLPSALGSKDLAGTWLGTLKSPDGDIPLALTISHAPDGSLKATLENPRQAMVAIALSSIEVSAGTLTFKHDMYGYSYSGIINPKSIDGTFSQGAQNLPLSFSRP